jgi:glycosyltransferase involved in cell wall biosynthesis
MTVLPMVDVNLFVRNGAATIGPVIESVLAQTWPALTLTVLDNASTDATVEIVRGYMAEVPHIRLLRARVDLGLAANCARAFAHGEADFVLPKTADDLLAPDFLARIMEVMLAHPACAMCHAGGIVFRADGRVRQVYPASHRLHAIGADPVARAQHVMARYTSAPSCWGVYRREATERLARFRHTAGWDHAVLAELALYGEIRHVATPLYLRRDGGKPVAQIARAATEAAQRGLPNDDALAALHWMTPLLTTAYTHVEMFAVARLAQAQRAALMEAAPRIFRARWGGLLRQEAAAFLAALPRLRAVPGAWRDAELPRAA